MRSPFLLILAATVIAGLTGLAAWGIWPVSSPSTIRSGALLLVDQAEARPMARFVAGVEAPIATQTTAGLRVRPVDPATLADVPGHAPISFGHHFTHAVSPDGRTLAAFVWPVEGGGGGEGGVLHLIDLMTWTDITPGVTVEDNLVELVFSPDGRSLFWALPTNLDPTRARYVSGGYELYRYDLGSAAPTLVTRFPPGFVPLYPGLAVLRGGTRLALIGLPLDLGNVALDVPEVVFVDLSEGRVVASVRLEGVKARAQRLGNDYHEFQPGLAWDVPRDRLYIAHADEDRLTVVDLERGILLSQTAIRPRAALLDRLARWLVPSAAAKDIPTTRRQALLDPDGRRLYLLHEPSVPRDPTTGQRQACRTTSTVQVVDTRDLSELSRRALPCAGGLALAPDGRRLLVHTFLAADGAPTDAEPAGQHYLVVLDGERLDERGRLEVAGAFYLRSFPPSFSPDGRYAYVVEALPKPEGHIAPRWIYRVLDLNAGRFVADRPIAGDYWGTPLLATVTP